MAIWAVLSTPNSATTSQQADDPVGGQFWNPSSKICEPMAVQADQSQVVGGEDAAHRRHRRRWPARDRTSGPRGRWR